MYPCIGRELRHYRISNFCKITECHICVGNHHLYSYSLSLLLKQWQMPAPWSSQVHVRYCLTQSGLTCPAWAPGTSSHVWPSCSMEQLTLPRPPLSPLAWLLSVRDWSSRPLFSWEAFLMASGRESHPDTQSSLTMDTRPLPCLPPTKS